VIEAGHGREALELFDDTVGSSRVCPLLAQRAAATSPLLNPQRHNRIDRRGAAGG
jgi:hypothetical protein